MPKTLISFDLQAGFGVFKKPDVNEGLQLTFNMLHKPALLGILGAIVGLEGYQKKGEFPEYYRQLASLQIGIEPLEGWHERGNFTKTVIKYTNTIGYANDGFNLLVTEQTLRKPAYRCYLLLDTDDPLQARLHECIHAGEAEYLPYFGKNECAAWWETTSVQTHEFSMEKPGALFSIATLFQTSIWTVKDEKDDGFNRFDLFDATLEPETYIYFERLPVGFDERLLQYRLVNFAFTNFSLKPTAKINNLFYLSNEYKYVQLF